MRALVVTLSVALLTVGTAQAQVEQAAQDVVEETHRVCSTLDALDAVHEIPCPTEACTLPNKDFPQVPDEVLPVHVNVDQCIEDLLGIVDTNALDRTDAVRATAAAG